MIKITIKTFKKKDTFKLSITQTLTIRILSNISNRNKISHVDYFLAYHGVVIRLN